MHNCEKLGFSGGVPRRRAGACSRRIALSPASWEVSPRVGHNAALPATGGHSLPRCRFATPRRGSLLPRPAEIRYPTSDSYPRPKAPSPRGLRPQAVGEFTVMGIFAPSNPPLNPNLKHFAIVNTVYLKEPFGRSGRRLRKKAKKQPNRASDSTKSFLTNQGDWYILLT